MYLNELQEFERVCENFPVGTIDKSFEEYKPTVRIIEALFSSLNVDNTDILAILKNIYETEDLAEILQAQDVLTHTYIYEQVLKLFYLVRNKQCKREVLDQWFNETIGRTL